MVLVNSTCFGKTKTPELRNISSCVINVFSVKYYVINVLYTHNKFSKTQENNCCRYKSSKPQNPEVDHQNATIISIFFMRSILQNCLCTKLVSSIVCGLYDINLRKFMNHHEMLWWRMFHFSAVLVIKKQ